MAGVAFSASERYVFEVQGARLLSLEVTFASPLLPRDGDVFTDVMVRAGTSVQPVALGRCRFELLVPGRQLGRLIPLDSPINCRELFRYGRLVRVQQIFDQLPLLLARKEAITKEFQQYTANLVYDLRVYRMLFDEIDAGLANESDATRTEVQAAMVEGPGRSYMRFFDERLRALEKLVSSFSRQEHERHGFYFRRHVWDIILASPFLARTNIRPRGYAGDSAMMRYLYENVYLGESTFGKLMHKHPIESAAAQAVRNRRRLIADTLATARRNRGDGARSRLRFMSVACGPAQEVTDLFVTAEDCNAYECVLLDQDDEALSEARQSIAAVEQRAGRQVHARFVRDSVRTMLRTHDLTTTFGRFDVLYSMGLFDYLTAPVAKAVLGKLYQLLEPGGWMIVGNFHVGNPTRCYMDYWMDWTLIYRTEEEFLALAHDLPGAKCSLSFEETKAQMFLTVRKARP